MFVLKIISFVYSCQNRKEKANQTKTMAKTTITTKHIQIIQLALNNIMNSLKFLVTVAGVKDFLWK